MSASKYIIDHKYDEGLTEDGAWLRSSEIAGSEEWIVEHDAMSRF
jgi:hypothetical protein